LINDYGTLGIFLLGGFAFALIVIITNWFVSRIISGIKKPSKEKETTYECGLETEGITWIQFKVSYFQYALIFVVFDVETVFLYPWAVAFKSVGLFAFGEMVIFIAILGIGLWYAWKEGALEWK
jgi:NADH:ubiquinone oxidoreductase subunit 3 (subunit A)